MKRNKDDRGPFWPEDDILKTAAPLVIWERVKREAARSPMRRFRVGAVIFDNTGILGGGCSHMSDTSHDCTYSVHAERHALRNLAHLDLDGAWIALYTMNANGGCAWSSRPCYSCASLLFKRGIARIVYPERLIDNSFIPRSYHPEELVSRNTIITGGWAKEQRISD